MTVHAKRFFFHQINKIKKNQLKKRDLTIKKHSIKAKLL